MLGNVLITKQTGPEGRLVSKLLVAGAPLIKKEFYLAVLLDRASSRPLMMASREGGVDIEEVAEKNPAAIVKETIDPAVGMMPYQARKLATALGLSGDLISPAVKLFLGVYKTWWECDASMSKSIPFALFRTRMAKRHCLPWMRRSVSMTMRSFDIRTSRKCATWRRKRLWKSRRASTA